MNYDSFGIAARDAYQHYATAIMADFLARRAANQGVSGVSALRSDGLGLLARLVQSQRDAATLYLGEHAQNSDVALRQHAYLDALKKIATKNLNDLIVQLMGGVTDGRRAADLLNRDAGAIGLLLQQKFAKPQLTVQDRAGRRWQAERLVQTMARDFAYQSYLDGQIADLDAQEVEWVEVRYPDPNHAHNGLVLRLDEVALVRASLFHPNASARLEPYVQANP